MRITSHYITFINELLRRKFQKEISKDIKPLDLIRKYPLIMKKYIQEIQITYKNDNKLKALKSIDGVVNLAKNENQRKLLINKLKLLKHTALNKGEKKIQSEITSNNILQTTVIKKTKIRTKPTKKIDIDGQQVFQQDIEETKTEKAEVRLYWNSPIAEQYSNSLKETIENINIQEKNLREEYSKDKQIADDTINKLTKDFDVYDKVIQVLIKEIQKILQAYEKNDISILDQKISLSSKAKELFELQEKCNRLKTTQLYHINNNKLEITSKYIDITTKLKQQMTEIYKSFTLVIENDKRLVDYGFIQKTADNNEIIDDKEILKLVSEIKEQHELMLNNNLQVKDIN